MCMKANKWIILLNLQVQDKTQYHPDTQSSGDKRKLAKENAPKSPVKYMRFELEGENDTNGWGLPSELVSYLKKYMSIHVSEKNIRDKVFSQNTVPRNIKSSQKLPSRHRT